MSDTSWTRAPAVPPVPAPPPAGRDLVPGLLRSLDPLLRGWLPRQRWFAGKGLPIGRLRLAAATELVPPGGRLGPLGLLHALIDVEQPGRPADCYQLPLGAHPLLPSTVDLTGETLYVEADRLLAFDGSLAQGTMFMGSQGGVMGVIRGQVTGQGLFTTTLQGKGSVAVMAHGGVFELPVTPGRPVHVDPQAYVAHRGEVRNKLATAVGWREMVGRGSGEAFQLELSGQGTVYVQASEEKL